VMCVLLLRGPQTPGELRGRSERMFRFEELSDVQATLQRLAQREPPLLQPLPRQPGMKEIRYAHLLCGEVAVAEAAPHTHAVGEPSKDDRIAQLEAEVRSARTELSQLRREFEEFRKQFQ